MGPDALKNIIIDLHGPGATDQISEDQIRSFTFAELTTLLEPVEVEADTDAATADATSTPDEAADAATPTIAPESDSSAVDDAEAEALEETEEPLDPRTRLDRHIQDADWLIFVILNVDPAASAESDAIKQFLRVRSEQLVDKRVVVLALDAPYFLDATEISNLSAYFGVYSRSQPF